MDSRQLGVSHYIRHCFKFKADFKTKLDLCFILVSSCSSFVRLAIEMEDVDMVKCCVDHMQDIPDALLTRCLQFYIR